jgi:queuine tRNA-ribosyltransferase
MKVINTKHGQIKLPAFMPDATYGSIKSISYADAKKAGVKEIVTTTMHIEQNIGSEFIKGFGGIHKFMGWDRPILTDSGGWQVFSLINRYKKSGSKDTNNFATGAGCSFIDVDTGKQFLLTPESSIKIQMNLGADILTALDYPILGDASYADRKRCVEINTNWAKRSLAEYKSYQLPATSYQLIGCVIQGGNDFELRKKSAEELLELDYDLYNFGGLPLHTPVTWKSKSEEGFFHDILQYVCELIPSTKYKYAMGVGQPTDIAFCVDIGWQLFDTVLPTRNARHGYLYVSEGQGEETKSYKFQVSSNKLSHDILRIKKELYTSDDKPIDENCKCECCQTVSRAYLRHLIRINEPAGFRLATIHNLTFYSEWMDKIRKVIGS